MDSNLQEIVEKLLPQIERFQNFEIQNLTQGNPGIAKINELKKVSSFEKLETLIFLSVLEGEFYLVSCAKYLESIKEKLSSLENVRSEENIIRIEKMLFDYSYLKDYITNRSSNLFQKKIFNFEIERKLFIRSDEDYNFFWLFSLNIKLAEIDEGYSCDDQTISTLLGYYHDLNIIIKNNILTNQISIILQLKLKCSILLYKILKRIEKSDKVIFNIFNDTFSSFRIESELRKNPTGRNFLEEINNQYFDYNIDMNSVSKRMQQSEKIIDVHRFLKFIKKGNFTAENSEYYQVSLKNLLLKFESKLKNIKREDHEYIPQGNEIAYRTTINLISNALLCLECDSIIANVNSKYSFNSFEQSYNSLKREFEKYTKIEDEKVPNFMLYKIYLQKLKELLKICDEKDKNILNEDGSHYEKVLPKIFHEAFSSLKHFKEKLLQSKNLNLMPIYLEIEECNKNKFFLDSQHILPSNYNYLLKVHDQYSDELKNLERIIFYIIPKNIKESLKEVFKKEVKEHQYNVITIIGLYASMITFVLANVSILPNLIKHSIGAVLAFMVAIGVVLFFFVATLKILFSGDKYLNFKIFKIPSFIVWIICAIFLTCLAFYKIEEYSKELFPIMPEILKVEK